MLATKIVYHKCAVCQEVLNTYWTINILDELVFEVKPCKNCMDIQRAEGYDDGIAATDED